MKFTVKLSEDGKKIEAVGGFDSNVIDAYWFGVEIGRKRGRDLSSMVFSSQLEECDFEIEVNNSVHLLGEIERRMQSES